MGRLFRNIFKKAQAYLLAIIHLYREITACVRILSVKMIEKLVVIDKGRMEAAFRAGTFEGVAEF